MLLNKFKVIVRDSSLSLTHNKLHKGCICNGLWDKELKLNLIYVTALCVISWVLSQQFLDVFETYLIKCHLMFEPNHMCQLFSEATFNSTSSNWLLKTQVSFILATETLHVGGTVLGINFWCYFTSTLCTYTLTFRLIWSAPVKFPVTCTFTAQIKKCHEINDLDEQNW